MCPLTRCVVSMGVAGAIAAEGTDIYALQISHASTSTNFGNQQAYPYFARTCGSDFSQGTALAATVLGLDVTPYVALVFTEDASSADMAAAFVSRLVPTLL